MLFRRWANGGIILCIDAKNGWHPFTFFYAILWQNGFLMFLRFIRVFFDCFRLIVFVSVGIPDFSSEKPSRRMAENGSRGHSSEDTSGDGHKEAW